VLALTIGWAGYHGKQVDQQVHCGFDLSDVQNEPVNTTNGGRVVCASNLGIDGRSCPARQPRASGSRLPGRSRRSALTCIAEDRADAGNSESSIVRQRSDGWFTG
jgi:hypothetical protein